MTRIRIDREKIHGKKKTNENKRMSSIARRINMSFWLKEVGNVILIDIVIAFLIVGAFAWWGREQLPQDVGNEILC